MDERSHSVRPLGPGGKVVRGADYDFSKLGFVPEEEADFSSDHNCN